MKHLLLKTALSTLLLLMPFKKTHQGFKRLDLSNRPLAEENGTFVTADSLRTIKSVLTTRWKDGLICGFIAYKAFVFLYAQLLPKGGAAGGKIKGTKLETDNHPRWRKEAMVLQELKEKADQEIKRLEEALEKEKALGFMHYREKTHLLSIFISLIGKEAMREFIEQEKTNHTVFFDEKNLVDYDQLDAAHKQVDLKKNFSTFLKRAGYKININKLTNHFLDTFTKE